MSSCDCDGCKAGTPCGDYKNLVGAIVAVQPQTPENLNNALSFPYPEMSGGPARPPGQGCLGCVHSTYCPALYWYRRNCFEQPDDYTGRACSSWSDDEADIVTAVSDFDRAENARRSCEGVLTEANRNGITAATTGSDRNGVIP